MAWINKEKLKELERSAQEFIKYKERQRKLEKYNDGLDYFIKSILQVNRTFIQSVGYILHNPDNRIVREYSHFNLKVYNFEIMSNGREFEWMFGYKNKEITYRISLKNVETDKYTEIPKGTFIVLPRFIYLNSDKEYSWKKEYQFSEIYSFFRDIKKNLENDEYLNKYAYEIDTELDEKQDYIDIQDALNSYEPPTFDPEF